jgi:DNA-binding NtrC family response regulator
MKPRILLIEDNASTRFGFVEYFSDEGYSVKEAARLSEAREAIAIQHFDAIILDINLPDGSGLEFIEKVRGLDPSVPIIVITGAGDIPIAVDAMRRGADNFLTKPIDNASLAVFLGKTLELGTLKRQQVARQRMERPDDPFFGESQVMKHVLDLARIAAHNDCPLLITGETGSGKGMLAKWIHRNSERSRYEFVEMNCSGLRGELLAREIFGHVRGAFTSADQDRKGLLDIADRGTLFLDEIGDMSIDVQAQFLKVLEDKCYRRLGDVKLLRSNFRLVCATNRDVDASVRSGQFRQDLFYRINLMTIHIPPLRERSEDIAGLATRTLRGFGAKELVLASDVMGMLKSYSWPGNIREFKNVLERALLLSRGAALRPEHLSGLVCQLDTPSFTPSNAASSAMHDMEKAHIATVVEQSSGNLTKAAEKLKISRSTLYRKLKQLAD